MDPRVRLVIALMEDDPRSSLSLAGMGRAVNLSASRLRHMFKEEVGMTPTQYMQRLRKERARQMLGTTFMSVKEIIHRVGINDGCRFARDFKRAHGMTPTQYRACAMSAAPPPGA
ncbi:MAG TPA: helix-turn-helix transcriptional regulator [Pyrinomonadaceae bacterium]|nr:helix-turn-helix transcriptional regulator [Pyrinomonadaceae bacterium]